MGTEVWKEIEQNISALERQIAELKSALGEALEGWRTSATRVDFPYEYIDEQEKHIKALEKQFLDI